MDQQVLPPLFEMDNFKDCINNEKNQYCIVEAKLNFSLLNNSVKQYVTNLVNDKTTYDRRIIHRALCIPNDDAWDDTSLYKYSSRIITEKISDFNLSAAPDDIACVENSTGITTYDKIVLGVAIFYFSFIIFATSCKHIGKFSEGFSKFSLVFLWKQRTINSENVDYQKLLSMQGFRFFSLLYLMVSHLFFFYTLGYMENPSYYEDMFAQPVYQLMSKLTLFTVLIYFLMSAWLLTVQVYNVFENHGELSVRHVGILILNRYFRLAVLAVVSIFIARTTIMRKLVGPIHFAEYILVKNACKDNWMQKVLFVNNFDYLFNICNPVSWYISADFQLYILNLFYLYIKLKYKLNTMKFFSLIFVTSCLCHGLLLYIYEVGIQFQPYLRNVELSNLKKSVVYVVAYMSTISVCSSSFIGVIMGTLYYNYKNKVFKNTWMLSVLWILSIFGILSLSIFLTGIESNLALAALLGSVIKPMFTLGIGLGIWGMSHNFGGVMKKIFENKYVVLLSHFTFCIYLLHTPIIMCLNNHILKPLVYSDYLLMKDFVITVITSYSLGILITLTVEEPGLTLQKKYLPQITKWAKYSKIKKNE